MRAFTVIFITVSLFTLYSIVRRPFSSSMASSSSSASVSYTHLDVYKRQLQVIVRDTEGYMLANLLRAHGFGVTTMEGDSLNYKRHILIIHLKRKRITEAAELIRESTEDSVITVNDIKTVYGGFVKGK